MKLNSAFSKDVYFELKSSLVDKGLILNDQVFNCLKTLAVNLAEGLEGRLKSSYHLHSLDPGFGKTESVASLLRVWKSRGFEPAGSVLVAVSTLAEIDTYVRRSGLDNGDYAVLVANGQPQNALGRGEHGRDSASMLFTTHQMLRTRVAGKPFSDAKAFHFNGQPRTLRIWDESYLPSEPVSIRLDALAGLAAPLRYRHGDFVNIVEKLVGDARRLGGGAMIEIPALPPLSPACFGTDHALALSLLGQRAVLALKGLEGREARIIVSGRELSLIGTTLRLPADMAPLVVVDASIRVRQTYQHWEATDPAVIRYPAAINDYRNLTLNVWQSSCGHNSLAEDETRKGIIDQITKVINDKSGEQWLVVHPLPRGYKLVEEIMYGLDCPANVNFINWGRHHGMNDYADVKNVIIIGSHLLPLSACEAYLIAATDGIVTCDPSQRAKEIRQGEFCHNMLQAVCRSRVRRSSGGVCGEAEVYLVLSPGFEPRSLLKTTFPGCRLTEWEPVARRPEPSVVKAIEALKSLMDASPCGKVAKSNLRDRLGFQREWFRQILHKPAFQQAASAHGWIITNRAFLRRSSM